jgi:hypothetical protein
MRIVVAVAVLVLLGLAAPRVVDPQTWVLAQAVHDLGPISGWRCAQSPTYVYDPTRERPDATLLADPPEASVLAEVPWLEIDRVEANLRGGDTLVTAHSDEDERVYVLAPGSYQALRVCNVHLANWQIVGEENVGSG